MAKTVLPKSAAAKASPGKTTRSKRSTKEEGAVVTLAVPAPGVYAPETEAFTVERYADPGAKRKRYSFAKIPDVLELPDLIELQKASFKWFITDGLKEAFDSISPIKDFTGNLVLEFGEHSLGEPKYTVEECRERDMTYSAPLRVRVRLITAESGEIKGIPDQEIFMGDFPLMTDKGTFMINGAERVIVSPARPFARRLLPWRIVDTNNRPTYNATIIPNRGAWIEFETDNGTKNDETEGTVGVRIDKNRKIYVSDVRARAQRVRISASTGRSDEAILALFDHTRRSIVELVSIKTKTSKPAKTRSKKSTRSCVRANPRTPKTPRSCSNRCSSMKSVTISRASAGTSFQRQTRKSGPRAPSCASTR